MSYVHCHACDWQQDDFWSGRYNPVKFFFTVDIPTWIRPRMVGVDPYMMSKSPTAAFWGLTSIKLVPWVQPENGPRAVNADGTEPKFVRQYSMHSWLILGQAFVKWVRRLFTQKWWTYGSWTKALKEGKGGCPKCGNHLCID